MGGTCVVCGTTQTKTSSLSFHRFPKKEPKRSIWLDACKLDQSSLKKNRTLICSKHFTENDYEHSISPHVRRWLVSSAVPIGGKPVTEVNQSAKRKPMEVKKNKSAVECLFTSDSADIVSTSAWSLVNMSEDTGVSQEYEHLMTNGDLETEPFFTSKASRHYYNFMKTTIAERRKMIKVLRNQTKRLLLRHESIKSRLRDLKLLPEETVASISV